MCYSHIALKKSIIPPTPLTDAEVVKTLIGIQDAIQFRLRLNEIIPVEMTRHRIGKRPTGSAVDREKNTYFSS